MYINKPLLRSTFANVNAKKGWNTQEVFTFPECKTLTIYSAICKMKVIFSLHVRHCVDPLPTDGVDVCFSITHRTGFLH